MFKFKGISSEDMQVVIEEEEHFIARASQRYEMTEIEGRDGAIFNELGYSVVERPIYVQCLNINKIDDILAWLNGEGEFEYKGRKTTARFYSELEPQRSSCIRIIDTTFIRDPFWYKANEEYSLVKDRKDKTVSGESIDLNDSAETKISELKISGNSVQNGEPTPDTPVEVESCGDNGSINEVICNKNLCNFGNLQNSHIGLTNNLNKNVWKISGTATSNDYVLSTMRINLGKFKVGKYCFSWKYSGNLSLISSGGVFISLFSKNNGTSTTIQNKSINTENKFTSFTLNEEAEISLGIWNTGNGNIYDIEIECQLELSETNTEIVEHKKQVYTIPTQQPFRECRGTRDTFIKKNNKWFERHYIARKIFDGTEIWSKINNTLIYYTTIDNIKVIRTNILPYAISNHFKPVLNKTEYCVGEMAQNNTSNPILYFSTSIEKVDSLKSWLSEKYNAGTPVYVDYILETPLDIECTEEQNKILDKIENEAKTYKNITHIYSTDEVSPYAEITYFTPTDEKINNEGNIQSRPILRLEKTVSEVVELTINDIRFKYNFEDDSYVEIDCEKKTVEYEGLNRNRRISIGYEFPKLNIGNNKIIMHSGDCIIKTIRKDRWL